MGPQSPDRGGQLRTASSPLHVLHVIGVSHRTASMKVRVRVDLEPGVVAPRHMHPGEEIINVLEGSLEYQVEGKQPVSLEAGDVLFIPAGAIHAARNVGRGKASELATYIVEKGQTTSGAGQMINPSRRRVLGRTST